jgi:predicted TIM-barrel fold metal-dependent hydrolase
MKNELPYPIISADGHVNEPEDLFDRLPKALRGKYERKIEPVEGGYIMKMMGVEIFIASPARKLTDDENMREFRQDKTGGRDLAVRLGYQARDGVAAEVVFPNQLLALGVAPDPEFNIALARAYNDWIYETFSPMPNHFIPAPLIPVDDLEAAIMESERCLKKGFRTLMLPCSYPWRPYDRRDYDPLWRLVEESGVPLNFHVFSGNVFIGTDFASIDYMGAEDFAKRPKSTGGVRDRTERLSTTVIGMAAGMGPIVHLTGGGVLERHPDLKFIVTEAECGWLAWTLQAMDAMQDRRRLGLLDLSLRPSEYFKRQGAVTISDDLVAIYNLEFTGVDNIMWGNDYPHDEGTYPHSAKHRKEIVDRVSTDDAYKIFVGNAARIYGFDIDALAKAP